MLCATSALGSRRSSSLQLLHVPIQIPFLRHVIAFLQHGSTCWLKKWGDPTSSDSQPPHFDPPPIPSYSSRRVHSETPIYVPPHSCLWVMGHHSNISSSICTHLHAYALLWIHMCTSACICMHMHPHECICMQMCTHAYPLKTHSMHSIHLHA